MNVPESQSDKSGNVYGREQLLFLSVIPPGILKEFKPE